MKKPRFVHRLPVILAVLPALIAAPGLAAAKRPGAELSAAKRPDAGDAAASRRQRIARAAEGLRDALVAQRRDFHRHPELSNREERTAGIVAERLRAIGLTDIKTGIARHGV